MCGKVSYTSYVRPSVLWAIAGETGSEFSNTVGDREVGFARIVTWFGKRKDGKVWLKDL